MTRAQLKSKAKNQINPNLLILILCHVIVYIISRLDFIAEIAARTYYYPIKIWNMWFRAFIGYEVDHFFGAFKEMIKNNAELNLGIMHLNDIFAKPSYPMGVIVLLSVLSAVSFIITPVFVLGIHNLYLRLAKNEKPSLDKFLGSVTSMSKAFVLKILMLVFTFLWSLLFIIPGIIKHISYSMSFYILAEHPEMTSGEALRESNRLMRGHKMNYFILMFSFIWWYFLAMLTWGFAYIYIYPYIYATKANFYLEIKSNSDSSDHKVRETQEDYEDGFKE